MKTILTLLPAALLTGCAGSFTYNPDYFFNYVEVSNLSGGPIENLSLQVIGSPKSLDCDRINANAICEVRFGKRRYPQQGVDLSWAHPDGSMKSDSLSPAVPVTYVSSLPLQVHLEIQEDGSVKAFYKQEEPGRNGSTFFSML